MLFSVASEVIPPVPFGSHAGAGPKEDETIQLQNEPIQIPPGLEVDRAGVEWLLIANVNLAFAGFEDEMLLSTPGKEVLCSCRSKDDLC